MKKILGIVVLGLLLSSNAYADTKEKVYLCRGDIGESLISINPPKFTIRYGTEVAISADLIEHEDRYLAEFGDRKIIYLLIKNLPPIHLSFYQNKEQMIGRYYTV